MNPASTVFLTDDDPAIRDAVGLLLRANGLAVETFASAVDFLESDAVQRPGCLLLDVRMPGMSGLELQAYLAREEIRIPVVIITGHGDVAMAVRAMRAGALDFIEKPFNDEALIASLRAALDADQRRRVDRLQRAEIARRLAELTPREHEVMVMVTEGRSNREIAAGLGVSTKTVEAHRARVMDKMRAQSLAELVRMCLVAGILANDAPAT